MWATESPAPAYLSSDPWMERMPFERYRSGPRSCSSFDSHSFSLPMSHFPSIWIPTDVTRSSCLWSRWLLCSWCSWWSCSCSCSCVQ